MKPKRRTTQNIIFHIFESSNSASARLSSIEEKLVLCVVGHLKIYFSMDILLTNTFFSGFIFNRFFSLFY